VALSLYDIAPLEALIGQGYTLLTPNFRLARRIKAEWDAQRIAAGERVWEPLSVKPLEIWLLEQWQLAVSNNLVAPISPLTTAQALELWRQIINQQQSQSADFHLLRPSAAADLAAQARETLLRWQVDIGARDIRPLFELDRDCSTFLEWLDLFDARLKKDGQCTLVDCLAQLPDLSGRLPATRVALVEFDLLAPLLRAALEALCVEVKDVSPAIRGEDRLMHPFNDKRAELQAVASWAADLHRTRPETTIGIVLSNMTADRVPLEYLLRREFDCLGHNYASLPVNFSTGITLDQAPVIRDALAALAMSLQQSTISTVEGLMRSRFVDLPDAQSALAQRFVRQLYGQGRAVVSITDLRNDANAVHLDGERGLRLGQYLETVLGMRSLRRKAQPSVWLEHFSEVLSVWGWPGNQTLDTLEYQQLILWQRTLEEFGAFDSVCGPMHFGEALALLRDCCRRQLSQPQTADSPIQVLGPLEAAGLSFKHLWLCGMQGASWPASPRPSPFIPLALQNRLHMPHANPEREWAFAETLMQQYVRTSQIVHASYCRQVEGVPEPPSALLQGFTLEAMPERSLIAPQWLQSHSHRIMETVADHHAKPLDAAQQFAMKGGSGLLEDQSQCPFRALARHRLQVEPLATFNVALSAGERGSLLHESLNSLWGELRDAATLQALDDAGEKQLVKRAAQAAIAKVPRHQQRKLGTGYWRLEEQRIISLLHEWLSVERQRSAFIVAERELDMTLELAQLQIRLRVDRVDQLPDGSRVIIDYKSGRSSVQDWLGKRPARPQLLLYSIAEPESVAGLAFATVRPRECRYTGLGRVAAAPGIGTDLGRVVDPAIGVNNWAELNESWRQTLERLAHEFVAGDAQVDPLTPASCTWCGLQPLCRVDDWIDENAELTQEVSE
jgi:ATP-dependent helicase/nuclease subunit B